MSETISKSFWSLKKNYCETPKRLSRLLQAVLVPGAEGPGDSLRDFCEGGRSSWKTSPVLKRDSLDQVAGDTLHATTCGMSITRCFYRVHMNIFVLQEDLIRMMIAEKKHPIARIKSNPATKHLN